MVTKKPNGKAKDELLEIALAITKNDSGDVLIIRRQKPEQGSDGSRLEWAFPGGKISDYESHEETAERETLEETGHYVAVLKRLSTRKHPQYPVKIHYFACNLATTATTQMIEDHEIAQIAWVKPEKLLKEFFKTDLDKAVAEYLEIEIKVKS